MLCKNESFAWGQPPCSDCDSFVNCNIAQKLAGTKICEGKIGLLFVNCNLLNCDVPADAVIRDCLCIQVDRCYWLHPESNLPVEPENCRHVVEIDTVTIDGQIVDTTYERKDTVL